MFKAAIWDFDGTLFDTYPGILKSFEKALEDDGVKENRDHILKLLKDFSIPVAYKHYKDIYNLSDDFMQRYHNYETNLDKTIARPYPYAKEICRDIKNNGGMNFLFTHRGSTTIEYLEVNGMLDYFTEIVTKEERVRLGLKSKPAPDPFLYFVDKYKLDKESVLSIGDRNIEILSAKGAGIKSCYYKTYDAAITEKPDYTINSLEELYELFGIKHEK